MLFIDCLCLIALISDSKLFLFQNLIKINPNMSTLLKISQDILDLEDHLFALEGDTEAQTEITDAWLSALDARDDKLDNYAALIREIELRAAARKEEAERLAKLVKQDMNHAEHLKNRLKFFFQTHQHKTIDTERFRISLVQNGGKTPVVLHTADPEALPEGFRLELVQYKPNMEAIREALDRGEDLEFAEYGERGSNLRIR